MFIKKYVCWILWLLPMVASAQLKLYPIAHGISNQAGERQKDLPHMSLPFWDDFSTATHTDTLWEDKANVWINAGSAINPPTINVATFDGLDANGMAYAPNPNQNLDFGPTDLLASRKIKMTDVPIGQRNFVFLSFYYQWGGFGESPERNDRLELEFLNNQGVWKPIQTFVAEENQQPDEFYYFNIRINQDEYYHDDFQFRFQAYGKQSGRFDMWHIDYVYMNQGRTEDDDSHPDRTLTVPASGMFGSYFSIPVKHFQTSFTLTNPSFGVANIKASQTNINFSTYGTFKNYVGQEIYTHSELFDFDTPLQGTDASIQGKERRTVIMQEFPPLTTTDTLLFNPKADSIQIELELSLNTKDNVIPDDNGDYIFATYNPIDFRSNDTLRTTYFLKNYYAYDDGIAEYALGLAQSGSVAAYRFVMQTPEADTLNGVYVYFPNSYGTFASTVTFYVWDDNNGRPGSLLLEELVPVQRNNNNQFVLRPFIQSAIVQDTFYIGWRQSTGRVLIGLDTSNDSGEHLFFNNAGANPNTWETTQIYGSPMIRPRFGPGAVVTSTEERTKKEVVLYPNPNKGEFFLEGNAHRVQVLSASGHPVNIEQFQEGENKKRVKLLTPMAGLYIVRYFDGQAYQSQKIIIQE
ncbi:MAG: T9SS type A sorting domain-containing protein [Cyclobacteriaceae bacterium]|nr:T9SS type A sorting domain-containing protein [Cyclobacteriaceae bacterium]